MYRCLAVVCLRIHICAIGDKKFNQIFAVILCRIMQGRFTEYVLYVYISALALVMS